jgi:hypothetical protein
MKFISAVVLAVGILVTTGCGRQFEAPPRVDPPKSGEAEIGVAYGVSIYCPVPIELGGLWWSFDEPTGHWPPYMNAVPFPFSIWQDVTSPYEVPGIVTLATPTTAVFRADVDGSQFALVGHEKNLSPGDACL